MPLHTLSYDRCVILTRLGAQRGLERNDTSDGVACSEPRRTSEPPSRACTASARLIRLATLLRIAFLALIVAMPARAQTPNTSQGHEAHDTPEVPRDASSPAQEPTQWTLGLDGVAFATFNKQGGPRGATEFGSQNWAMAMGMRRFGRGLFAVTGMVSAEPLTTPPGGSAELLQVGETYHGLPIIDQQHPHDLLMQISAAWRVPLGRRLSLTVAAAPRGDAALGPVAFMHRQSSAENPTAPLSHHILDSTHIAGSVVLAGLTAGPATIETSWLRGREPDEHRYDLEIGRPDSWSVRGWFRPSRAWTVQASHGMLHEPEPQEPGDQRRTNASISWLRDRGSHVTAVTVAAGRNVRRFSTVHALLVEATERVGRTAVYTRIEDLTTETEILLFPGVVHRPHPGELVDPVRTVTAGALRDVATIRGAAVGLGADLTIYALPLLLQYTHTAHPVSFHVFLRIRPPAHGVRMWNMTMGHIGAEHTAMNEHDVMQHDDR